MTIGELMDCLLEFDPDQQVEFNTADRFGMTLLSAYPDKDNKGKKVVQIDIGHGDE